MSFNNQNSDKQKIDKKRLDDLFLSYDELSPRDKKIFISTLIQFIDKVDTVKQILNYLSNENLINIKFYIDGLLNKPLTMSKLIEEETPITNETSIEEETPIINETFIKIETPKKEVKETKPSNPTSEKIQQLKERKEKEQNNKKEQYKKFQEELKSLKPLAPVVLEENKIKYSKILDSHDYYINYDNNSLIDFTNIYAKEKGKGNFQYFYNGYQNPNIEISEKIKNKWYPYDCPNNYKSYLMKILCGKDFKAINFTLYHCHFDRINVNKHTGEKKMILGYPARTYELFFKTLKEIIFEYFKNDKESLNKGFIDDPDHLFNVSKFNLAQQPLSNYKYIPLLFPNYDIKDCRNEYKEYKDGTSIQTVSVKMSLVLLSNGIFYTPIFYLNDLKHELNEEGEKRFVKMD